MQPLPLLIPPALKKVVDNLGLAEWSTGEDRVSWLCESSERVREEDPDDDVEDRDDDVEDVAEAMTRPEELTAKQNEPTNCCSAPFMCAHGGNGHTH